jgi:hypothetical protein
MLSTTHPQPREQQDLARLRDKLAVHWAKGQTLGQIGAALGMSRGAIIGLISRARARGDDRFRSRPTTPKPKVHRLKPVDEAVGKRKPLRPPLPPPEPSRPVPFLLLRPGRRKFPLNSPERGRLWVEMMCCGAPVVRSGANYCQQHAEITRALSPRAPSVRG